MKDKIAPVALLPHSNILLSSGPPGGIARPTEFGKERERMVKGLISEGLLRSEQVIESLKKVPREHFVPEHLRPYAYSDTPLPTGHGQTISAPRGSHLPGVTWLPS